MNDKQEASEGRHFVRKLPAEEQRPIGAWGQRHLRYLRQHRKALYTELQITGKLNAYLADLNEQAEAVFLELVKQMAAREGVTEQLKVQDQMLWGAGLRWRPLPKAEAPTEAAAETSE